MLTSKESTHTNKANLLILLGVSACFALSGFAALLYQTAWMRQFSLVFGTSELAVAAVLSAYMGGLAFGAALASRYIHRITRPVLFYGVLEAGIALSALLVPLLLKVASLLYVGIFGGQPEPVDASGLGQSFFYLLIAFLVLSIPTALMGATLPLLTKYVVQSDEQIGPRVGLLYAINTIGAVAGTIVAAFVLLPRFGLSGTIWFGVVVNLLVFVLAAMIARSPQVAESHQAIPEEKRSDVSAAVAPRRRESWILPMMLISGAVSFMYEVLWTRLLGHVLGGSVTAFATMLAGFLTGIAVGSAIASRFALTKSAALTTFIIMQICIAIASILIYQLMPGLVSGAAGLKGNVLMAVLILLPATVFIGATFPVAVKILALDKSDAARSSAVVYSWNTVGAIVGSTIAAFFLIPILKYEGAIKLAVLTNLGLAAFSAFLIGEKRYRTAAVSALLAIVAVIFYNPGMPEDILRNSPVYRMPSGDIRYYEVGRSATVLVIEEDGYLNLRTNGLPEASTSLKGAPPYKHTQRLLSTMPVLARPETKEMLVIGFGAGVTLEGVPPSVESIDVIELEPEVIAANRSYSQERAINPLDDPRISITINDARSALTLSDKKYDSIVSQPSHPWTAGASHLYTREFMALVKEHLTDDGVFLQWMNTQFVDEHLLKSLCATLLDVYPHVRVYQWDPEVLFFLGSEQPLNVEQAMLESGAPIKDHPAHYLQKGIGSVEDVVVALAMDQENVERFAKDGQIITDNYNIMATHSVRAMEEQKTLTRYRLFKALKPFDPLLQPESAIHTEFKDKLNLLYMSRLTENIGMKQRSIDFADLLIDEKDPQGLYLIGVGQQQQGDMNESQKNLRIALEDEPENQQIRYSLLRPWFTKLGNGDKIPDYVSDELLKMEGPGAITIRAWLAAHKKEMNIVAQLDAQLATAAVPTDIWFLESLKLRADWRIKVTNPEMQPRLAREATILIDNAIAIYQDPEFYSMRLASTHVAKDAAGSLETARRLIHLFQDEVANAEDGLISPDAKAISIKLRQISAAQKVLDELKGDPRIPQYKLNQLNDSINDLTYRLNYLSDGY